MAFKLGGVAIRTAFASGVWNAFIGDGPLPVERLRIGPNSVDATLHRNLLVPRMDHGAILDPCGDPDQIAWTTAPIGPDGWILPPGGFVLGAVRERFDCGAPLGLAIGRRVVDGVAHAVHVDVRFAPMYEGRSTCGRIGLASHITAGFGDHGFDGAFTLEIFNHFPRPIRLREGMRIGQVAFDAVHEPTVYAGAYRGKGHRDGPVAPVIGRGRFMSDDMPA